MSRYLGIDYGTKRIGLAVGERESGIASPLRAVDSQNDPAPDAEAVLAAADDYTFDAIVIGLPVHMDGAEGTEAKRARRFAAAVRARTTLPVHLFDERLTSFAADQNLRERELTRHQKRARRDGLAATHLLTMFFEHLAGGGLPADGE